MSQPRSMILGSLLFLLNAVWAAGASLYQAAASPSAASPTPTIFHAGPGVTAPELVAPEIPIVKVHHCEKLDGHPVIALVVDANGNPSRLAITDPAEGNLNEAALALVAKDRFKPGTHDGVPAAVAIQIQVGLKTCGRYAPQGSGVFILASLRERPVQNVKILPPLSPEIAEALRESHTRPTAAYSGDSGKPLGKVTAPVPLNAVEARYTDAARKARITGVCLVKLIVDASGMPMSPQIIKSLDPGLDQEAIKAVMQYRFKPARHNGVPVPVQIVVEINFRLR